MSMNQRIAGYSVLSTLQRGADDVLLLGRRQGDGAQVLIQTHTAARADARTLARYRRAFELARRLDSPHVSRPLQLVETPERTALVHPGTDARLLASRMRPEGLSLAEFLRLAISLAEALDAIHRERLVHGDVRPTSILVDAETSRARFLDLGWATALDQPAEAGGAAASMLPYLAPEQTGRVGRTVDQRADVYSLGAVFFELLCGRPPFVAEDPLTLVHGHIAGVAPPVGELRPELPQVAGEIVRKMLAKSPDERYQGCRGLLADLRRCRAHVERGEPVPWFEPGSEDTLAQLELPDKLYGREAELAQVLDAFARASGGRAELLLVAGPPGVGKSALIAAIDPRVHDAGGFFAYGKFDQLGLNVPCSAVKQAFGELVRSLLGEREERIQHWRDLLAGALGNQGRILTDLLPDLECLVGAQPQVELLGPVEAQHRFTLLFRRFVQVFARPEHPLVVFLDDWQWADAASARLVQEIAGAPDAGALLLIVAYRDTELTPSHPALVAFERIQTASVPITRLTLPPLGLAHLEAFVRDALRCPDEHARALAAIVASRTGGNPFFARLFLHALHEAGALLPEAGGGWRCDLERLERATAGESVEDFVVARIGRLPRPTRALLQVAACLGSELRLSDLAVASARDEATVAVELTAALDAGLVLRGSPAFRFVHDRVQEAAYTSLPAEARAGLHLAIGRRLLARGERTGGAELLAQAVEQLDAGRALVVDPAERLELARLNLHAGRHARQATAYASAARHAAVGIELLAADGWTMSYELALDLHVLRAESEYLSGRFAIAEELYEVALGHARTDLDRIRILTIQKDQYELQGRFLDAIAAARAGLALVGVELPDDQLDGLLETELAALPRNLAGRPIHSLIDAPEITDPRLIATLQLLVGLRPSCYVASLMRLLKVVAVKLANFCLVHGNCEVASAAYIYYSFIAGPVTGDYASAYEFGRLGIALSERYPNRAIRTSCYFLFGCGTAVWRRPLSECAPYLERAVELGLESGNLPGACYASSYIVTDAFFRGLGIVEVEKLYARYSDFLARYSPTIHLYLELGLLSMRRLAGRDTFDEASFLRTFQQHQFFRAACCFGQLAAAYHLDDVDRARACADAAIASVPELLPGIYKVPETALYAALSWLAASERAPADERARLKEAAARQLAYLWQLARECEESFLHKALLVEAELARVEGRSEEAALLFDRASEEAAGAGFQQHAALASELAARLWRDRGYPKVACMYLQEAYEGYRAWGATAKLQALEARHPELSRMRAPAAGVARDSWAGPFGDPLDLVSVTKASQAISREIELDALLGRLMTVMIENAGARRGALLLTEGDVPHVLASAEGLRVEVGGAVPLDAAADVTESVVRYVARTGETVLLDDAMREGRFVHDPQVRQRGSRSILCMPLRLKDQVMGAVYLENELSAGAFTPARARVLELLAGQAAISLENARLYTDLKAAIRRQDEARVAAEQANRAKDEFLAILGHELRNPLAPILTACQLMAMRSPTVLEREREVIERQVRHMMRLVDDLLDVSRIARGKIELVRKPIDLSDVASEAIELVMPLIERRDIRLDVRMHAGPLPVYGDATRLAQVLSNILTNAVKFSETGGPVSIELAAEDDEAVVRIRDRGAGIDADLLPTIFDLFVQGNQPRDRTTGGLGLGLTIARNLIGMHGGSISAHSEGAGHGSEFCIRLPLLASAGVPATVAPEPGSSQQRPRRRVLVVDDNVDAAQLLVQALMMMGHETVVVHDGPAALRSLDEFQPDVALLDIGLPVMDGFELARRIREKLGSSAPRLVAVSGYGPSSHAGVANTQVFDEYVVKPISVEQLEQAL